MKSLFVCCFCLLSFTLHAQLVSFGQRDSVMSDILKEKRPLWIYTPPDDTAYFSRPQFPVMYVLDGDAHFETLQTMIQELGVKEGNTVFPQMIIVGILNTGNNRMKNLGEGREEFLSFMQKELFPYIEKKYATAPYRILIGHSMGGLLAAYTLLHHQEMFNAYVATDPSLFFQDGAFMKEAPELLKQNFSGKTFYLAGAGEMNTPLGHTHTTAIKSFAALLSATKDNHLRSAFKYYPDDDHHSVPFIGIYDGLRFVFPHNRFQTFLFRDDTCPTDSLKALVSAHYKQLSEDMGYTVRPPEGFLNQMGYWNLEEKRYDKSAYAFQLNIDNYPKSFNVYDSMGDYYKETGNVPKAIELYKKALSLRNSAEIRAKLEKTIAAADAGKKTSRSDPSH